MRMCSSCGICCLFEPLTWAGLSAIVELAEDRSMLRNIRAAADDDTWAAFKAQAAANQLTVEQALGLAISAFAQGRIQGEGEGSGSAFGDLVTSWRKVGKRASRRYSSDGRTAAVSNQVDSL